jgi:hypothetical protein
MAIIVVCPGCRKSFQVSDKFAGKSGPCPKCKHVIRVPLLSEQVQVHEPPEFSGAGRNALGRGAFKPVERTDAKFQPEVTAILVASSLFVLFLTWVIGKIGWFHHLTVAAAGLLIVSPPLVLGAYEVLRDVEFEPFRGKSLYFRAMICSVAYASLWAVLTLLASRGIVNHELWGWLFVLPPFLVIGSLAPLACLDMNFGDALFHFGFYLFVVTVLRWIAGMKWVWNLS